MHLGCLRSPKNPGRQVLDLFPWKQATKCSGYHVGESLYQEHMQEGSGCHSAEAFSYLVLHCPLHQARFLCDDKIILVARCDNLIICFPSMLCKYLSDFKVSKVYDQKSEKC